MGNIWSMWSFMCIIESYNNNNQLEIVQFA